MVRRSYRYSRARRTRPLKTVKYSNETFNSTFEFAQGASQQQYAILIAPISSQGMRKAKNFTLRISCSKAPLLLWALVYVPDGTVPQPINLAPPVQQQAPNSVSYYEPNQNVIMSGFLYPGTPQETFRTRLARNLNSGDCIALILRPAIQADEQSYAYASLNYAISY